MATCTSLVGIDWNDSDAVSAFIDHALRLKEEHWWDIESQDDMSIAWLDGHQTVLPSRTGALHRYPKQRQWQIFNHMRSYTNSGIAMLGQTLGRVHVRPASGDDSDYLTSKLSRGVADYLERYHGMADLLERADRWIYSTGYVAAKVVWDPSAGPEMPISPADLGMTDKQYKARYPDIKSMFFGDVSWSLRSKFNMFWWPLNGPLAKADWVIEVDDMSRSQAMAEWDLDDEELGAPGGKDEYRLWRPGDYAGAAGSRFYAPEDDDTVRRVTLWVRRNPYTNAPRGRRVVRVGKTIVRNTINPYAHGRVPFVDYWFYDGQNSFVGRSPQPDVITPQHEINRTWTMIGEIVGRHAFPWILTSKNANLNAEQWLRDFWLKEYDGGAQNKPDVYTGENVPASVFGVYDRMHRMMQDFYGVHDASRGINSAGVRSAAMHRVMRGADENVLGPVRRRRQAFRSDILRLSLQTLAQFATDERMIPLLGDEGDQAEVAMFRGEMLMGNRQDPRLNYFDVVIQDAGVQRSRADTEAIMTDLLKSGQLKFDNPADRSLFFRSLEWGHEEQTMDPEHDDRETQERRNRQMARGQYEPPEMRDGHETLLKVLHKFQKSDTYRFLPPETKAMYDQYEAEVNTVRVKKKIRDEMVGIAVTQGLARLAAASQQAALPSGNGM